MDGNRCISSQLKFIDDHDPQWPYKEGESKASAILLLRNFVISDGGPRFSVRVGSRLGLFNFVGHRNHPGGIIRIGFLECLDHSFFECIFDDFYLSRPKLELDTQITPWTILDILDPEDFRYGQNDGFVLVVHAPANYLNRLRHLLFIDLLGQLNVDVGPDAATAKLANGSNISVGDYNSLTVQVNQHGESKSDAIDLADFIAQFNHFPDS